MFVHSFSVAIGLSSIFLLETLKSYTNANYLALEKPLESHGKVRYGVFKAQFTKITFYFGCLHCGQKTSDNKTLSTDSNN